MKAKTPRRRERVTKAVSLTTALVTWAEAEAKTENRSLSNFIETMLQRYKEEGNANPQASHEMANAH